MDLAAKWHRLLYGAEQIPTLMMQDSRKEEGFCPRVSQDLLKFIEATEEGLRCSCTLI